MSSSQGTGCPLLFCEVISLNKSKSSYYKLFRLALIIVILVLLLIGVAALLIVNARSVSDYFKENMQLSVLLKQDVTEDQGEGG